MNLSCLKVCGTSSLAEELLASYEGLLLYEVGWGRCKVITTYAAAWGWVGCILDFAPNIFCMYILILLYLPCFIAHCTVLDSVHRLINFNYNECILSLSEYS
jgi:hypothetical protein